MHHFGVQIPRGGANVGGCLTNKHPSFKYSTVSQQVITEGCIYYAVVMFALVFIS